MIHLIDIDGVLLDPTWRTHRLPPGHHHNDLSKLKDDDIHRFMQFCEQDPACVHGTAILGATYERTGYNNDVILFTSRFSDYEKQTRQALGLHYGIGAARLLMRPRELVRAASCQLKMAWAAAFAVRDSVHVWDDDEETVTLCVQLPRVSGKVVGT